MLILDDLDYMLHNVTVIRIMLYIINKIHYRDIIYIISW